MGSSNLIMTKPQQQQSTNAPTRSVPFRSEIRASGAGETWSHTDDGNSKFQQFGWRCTNDENAYKEDVLIGNWNEKQFDVQRVVNNIDTASPFQHYYETTYGAGYKKKSLVQLGQERLELKRELTKRSGECGRSFPAHQPELDTRTRQMITTSQLAYGVGTSTKKTKK